MCRAVITNVNERIKKKDKKGKKLRKKIKKRQIENLEKFEISEIMERLFRVFLFPRFQFCPAAKIEKSDLKISEKSLRFRPAHRKLTSI